MIYKRAIDRLASRCTGSPETGGAHKYGEGNWQKGLPTSDTINHIIDHITKWQDTFRSALTGAINKGVDPQFMMGHVQHVMEIHTQNDDDLAGAMWGIMVLMYQEEHGMFHDDSFAIPGVPVDLHEVENTKMDDIYVHLMHAEDKELKEILDFVGTVQMTRNRAAAGILKEEAPKKRKSDGKHKVKSVPRRISSTKRAR